MTCNMDGVLFLLLIAALAAWLYEFRWARTYHDAMHDYKTASECWKQAAERYKQAYDEQKKMIEDLWPSVAKTS